MKKLFLSLAFMALTTLLLAQQGYEDVVYLKNGTILHGVIIEQIPNKSIKIQTADRNVFVFKIDEIERFTKEEVPTTKNVQANEKSLVEIPSGLEKGYQFILEPGVAVGVDYNEVEMAKIDVVNGIRFNPYIALGLGTGIRSYNEVLAVPIFLDLRVNFIKTRVSPYLSLGLGYSLALDETELGAFAQPAIGISYRIGKATAMHIGLSLIAQSFTEESVYSYNYYYETTYYSQSYDEVLYSVGLNVGFSF